MLVLVNRHRESLRGLELSTAEASAGEPSRNLTRYDFSRTILFFEHFLHRDDLENERHSAMLFDL